MIALTSIVGHSCRAFEIMKGSSPLENFTHTFSESSHVEEALVSQADVILANLQDADVKEAVMRTHQAIMRGDCYCVYIIDWLLPDMNGVEVTRRVRKEVGDEVPVIVLSAYDWSDIEEEAREAGVTAFCNKPLFLSELKSCLQSAINTEGQKVQEETQKSVSRHTGRILLVEDMELNQEVATAILEDAGFVTEVAQNGREAVEMMRKSQPGYYQLVLMDVQMPVMNGYEAAKAIRNLGDRVLA